MKYLLSLICIVSFCSFSDLKEGLYAKITTPKGEIVVKLEMEKAPMTVANFVGLAEGSIPNSFRAIGQPFYDGLNFHRVVKDGIIQGGCQLGTGYGMPGYKFKDEFDNRLKFDKSGVLAMGNAGKNTNGSQFFITMKPIPVLDGKHSIFGQVIEGLSVVSLIVEGDIITKIKIIRVGKAANEFDVAKEFPEKLRKKVK